jgi:hypothetical protein
LSRSLSRWPKSSGSRRPAISILLAEIERFEKAGYLDPARRGDRADEAEGDLVTPIWRHVAALGLVPASPVDGRLEAGWLGHCPQEKRDALQPRNTYGLPSVRDLHSPRMPRRRSSRISSAMLVRDSRTSSVNGAFGRHERQDRAEMRLVTAASR